MSVLICATDEWNDNSINQLILEINVYITVCVKESYFRNFRYDYSHSCEDDGTFCSGEIK